MQASTDNDIKIKCSVRIISNHYNLSGDDIITLSNTLGLAAFSVNELRSIDEIPDKKGHISSIIENYNIKKAQYNAETLSANDNEIYIKIFGNAEINKLLDDLCQQNTVVNQKVDILLQSTKFIPFYEEELKKLQARNKLKAQEEQQRLLKKITLDDKTFEHYVIISENNSFATTDNKDNQDALEKAFRVEAEFMSSVEKNGLERTFYVIYNNGNHWPAAKCVLSPQKDGKTKVDLCIIDSLGEKPKIKQGSEVQNYKLPHSYELGNYEYIYTAQQKTDIEGKTTCGIRAAVNIALVEDTLGKQITPKELHTISPQEDILRKSTSKLIENGDKVAFIKQISFIDSRLQPINLKDPSALKKTLHGVSYQVALLTLAACRAHFKSIPFHLVSEAGGFEKFDDLVIDYGNRITFLQAKHSANLEIEFYNVTDFTAEPKKSGTPMSLAKYFDSWVKLKTGEFVKKDDNSIKSSKYILFTNKGIKDCNKFLEDCNIDDDKFLFDKLNSKSMKFRKGDSCKQFIEAIKSQSKEIKLTLKLYNIDDIQLEEAIKYLTNGNSGFNRKKVNDKRSIFQIINASTQTEPIKNSAKAFFINEDIRKRIIEKATNMKKDINKLNKLLQKYPMPPSFIAIDGVDQKIHEFLDELIIKIEQPNKDKLKEVITQELSLNVNIGLQELDHALHNHMFKWLENSKNFLLTFNEFGNIIKITEANINRFYFLHFTKAYIKECKKYLSLINNEDVEISGLEDFLRKDDNSRPIAIMNASENNGIKPRIYQTIEKLNEVDKLKNDNWIFLDIIDINFYNSEKLLATLNNEATKLIIIDCQKQFSDATAKIIYQILTKINSTKTQKKLILLTNSSKNDEIFNKMKQDLKPLNFNIPLLTDEQICKICESYSNKTVSIAGKSFLISQIIADKSNGMYQLMKSLDWLKIILEGAKDLINIEKPSLGLPYDVYEANELVKGKPKYGLRSILETVQKEIFIIDCMSRVPQLIALLNNWFNEDKKSSVFIEDSSKVTDKTRYCLVDDLTSLKVKKNEKLIYIKSNDDDFPIQHLNQSYIHLKIINTDFDVIVVYSQDSQLPTISGYDFSTSNDPMLRSESGFSVLSSNAGFGKSSFCLNEQHVWRISEENKLLNLITRINLPKLNFRSDNPEIIEAFTLDSTGQRWDNWQLEALKINMSVSNKVLLLLDGFDEIKSKISIIRFNNWLAKLPLETMILITTRPYAANKIIPPNTQSSWNYYILKPFTEGQRKNYVKKYFEAIIEIECKKYSYKIPEKTNIESIASQLHTKLIAVTNEKVMGLLGIPLESYIFCESYKPLILEWLTNTEKIELNLDRLFPSETQLNIITLCQSFILTKLIFFLQKHMEISLETTLKFKHRIYSLTASYSDILMVFAFKQAFNLSYGFVDENLCRTHYTKEMVKKDLSDMGLVNVGNYGREWILNFNHEIYQEYFSALFILRSLSNSKDPSYPVVKEIILKCRYDQKYRMIMRMVAQLSLSGDPLIPGWDGKNGNQVKSFWQILAESGDIIGAATARLFKECLENLSIGHQEHLKNLIKDEPWATKHLLNNIDQYNTEKEDIILEEIYEDLPIFVENELQKETSLSNENDINQLKESLKDKGKVFQETKKALVLVGPVHLAKLFEEIIQPNARINSYWDIDGGFMAMSLLGNSFNDTLANYFIKRINNDPEWRVPSALQSMAIIFKPTLKEEALNACSNVILCLSTEVFSSNKFLITELKQLVGILQVSPSTFLEALSSKLKRELSTVVDKFDINDINDQITCFSASIKLFLNIINITAALEYLMLIKDNCRKIIIYADKDIEIDIEDNAINDLFIKIIKNIQLYMRETPYNKRKYIIYQTQFISNLQEEIEKELLKLISQDENRFNKVFEDNINNNLVALYSFLAKYKLDMTYAVKKLSNYNLWDIKGSYWALMYGIKTVGHSGKYFNQNLADRLTQRAGMWPNNETTAVRALESIYKDLTTIISNKEELDDLSKLAIETYNNSISIDIFKRLKPIILPDKINQSTLESNNITDFDYISKSKEVSKTFEGDNGTHNEGIRISELDYISSLKSRTAGRGGKVPRGYMHRSTRSANSNNQTSIVSPFSPWNNDGAHNQGPEHNAFNNRDKLKYQYQTEDVYAIGTQIVMEAGQDPEILVKSTGAFRPTSYFEGSSSTLTRGQNVNNQTTDILTAKKKLLDGNKIDKIVGVINLGDVHWVTFIIVKNIELEDNSTGYQMYYKDPMGGSEPNQNFETMARDIFGDKLEIHCHKLLQQFDSVSCGVYALTNLKILLEPTINLLKFDEVQFYDPTNDQLKDKRVEFGESYEKQQNFMSLQEEIKRLEFQAIKSLHTQEAEELESDLIKKMPEIRVEINIVKETKRCFFRIEMPVNKNDEGYRLLNEFFNSTDIEHIENSTVSAYKIYVDQPRKSLKITDVGNNNSTSAESLPISVPTSQNSKQAKPSSNSSNEEFNNLLKEKLAGVKVNIDSNGPDDTCTVKTHIDNCVKVTLLLSTILGIDGIEQTKVEEGMITIKLDPKKLLVKDTTPKPLNSNNNKWRNLVEEQGQERLGQGK